MPLLRLTQHAEADGTYRVELAFEREREPRQTAVARFPFEVTAQDEADLRWYLEDYLQWPQDPAPTIAARVEERMKELGTELFRAIFQADDDTRELWSAARRDLAQARLEIVTSVEEATAIPWELLRDPRSDSALALTAHSFVRAHSTPARQPRLPEGDDRRLRVLLVICRPRAGDDVPFRSVAGRLVKGLSQDARELFDLHVLRPPTYEQLARELRRAKSEGTPYHAVHFDGHGVFTETAKEGALERLIAGLKPILLSSRRQGKHGYLLFENPDRDDNMQLVDGPALGRLLVEGDVPVLVLNACRSAHAEPRQAPESADDDAAGTDLHARTRAIGSLAQEVMDAGVAGVVAMRYNVYVVTAAQFVAELYAALGRGPTLGEAVTLGRKNLADQPLREVAADPLPLQDWTVPIVYEAAPIALFQAPADDRKLDIRLEEAQITAEGGLDSALPPTPDAGFWGRDETLLALDRAFDTHPIVLLHAYAGSGKTATAAEFARWYALTGGVDGPVLFTTFEQHRPLARVLDRVGEVFGPTLEQQGVHWLALGDDQRRQLALQVLAQVPVLWIWDNFEPVAGFGGVESAWSAEEQRELADFLRAARDTKARFLLTSRREEEAWLGGLPRRIPVPPMPMTERLQLARAIADRRGEKVEMKDWRPLLRFSGGNPLTLTVLVGQALRDKLSGRAEVGAFVKRLRVGEAAFDDEASEGRSRSLGASLGYGFEHAFAEDERRQLALLHLFQGFVDVVSLCWMGRPENAWCLRSVRGLDREAAAALLDRAAEVGLLRPHGGGYFSIHPALPWFFRELFEEHYGASQDAAVRAFVEATGELGNYYFWQYEGGNRDVIGALRAEKANLLQARRLARAHGWWGPVAGAMQGLRQLYGHTGRRAEWKRLVDEVVPDFVDPGTEGPRAGREEQWWDLVTHYRMLLAQDERNWAEAERLLQPRLEWSRQQAAPLLARPRESLDSRERNTVHNLAASLENLGHVRRKRGNEDCVGAYEEALELAESIGDRTAAAICAFNLGHAYKDLTDLRDLAQADRWCRRSLELTEKRDRVGRGRCLAQLGHVAFEQFREARSCKSGEDELLRHQNEAAGFYTEALELFPPDALGDLAVAHNALGEIYRNRSDIDRALPHFRDAIRYEEQQSNVYGASSTRFNVALALGQSRRPRDALEYARAALRGFESLGESAAEMIQRTRQLIGRIEEQL